MIQVIKRCFFVLELIKKSGSLRLSDLEEKTGINKGTLCNILKTLTDLGYVRKCGRGEYIFANALYDLAVPAESLSPFVSVARKHMEEMAKDLREGTIGVLRKGFQFYRFAKIYFRDDELITEYNIAPVSVLGMAASWMLLASQPGSEMESLLQTLDFPIKNIHGCFESIEEAVAGLKKTFEKGIYAVELSEQSFNRVALAEPVRFPNGKVEAAISVSLPKTRFIGAYKDILTERLTKTGRQIEEELA